ncbi:MAG: hypothetical protein GX605_10345 [Chloroflexi bacterium]|nr:hypothetical protein [Chloroflexota bacterium]
MELHLDEPQRPAHLQDRGAAAESAPVRPRPAQPAGARQRPAHLLDTIRITATAEYTPTWQAVGQAQVLLLPDPATCAVQDVAISQVASGEVVTAGERVTVTLSVTHFGSVAVRPQP